MDSAATFHLLLDGLCQLGNFRSKSIDNYKSIATSPHTDGASTNDAVAPHATRLHADTKLCTLAYEFAKGRVTSTIVKGG
jgi:hypothetical protein